MADHDDTAHEHGEIHLPPNSFIPIVVAIALSVTFVGFLNEVRSTLGPLVWIAGLLLLIGSLVAWFLSARSEYLDLPE
jgi:hypothetical protein